MPNELTVETRRTGDLYVFDEDTPPVKAVLARTDEGISAEVPWSSSSDHQASWFLGDGFQGMPTLTKPAPKRLAFVDSHGVIQLVDCWPRGFRSNFDSGVGWMWAKYAVMDVRSDVDFAKVDGLASEVSGLRDWLGVSSVHEQDPGPAVRAVTVVGQRADEIVVTPELTLVPTFSTDRPAGTGTTVFRDYVLCRTRVETLEDWDVLSRTHLGVRDLLVLARWRPETCTVIMVTRHDDPMMTLDGTEHGRQWRDVVVGRYEEPPAFASGYRPYTFEYDEIGGAEGVARWLLLRDEFSRALDPIITDRYLQHVPALTHLAQVGPGLEALGYLLRIRDGATKSEASNTRLRERLDRIASAVELAVPFDALMWAEEMTRAYNGIKHANRDLPDELDLLNRWIESVTVVRAWVAGELGVQPEVVRRRLELDPNAARFRARH